jgi:DNA (cytosine-5)-methyltransferase 1
VTKKKAKQKKPVTFIDLFAGIGGFHYAFHDHGAECVFVSEWDKHARTTYERNFKKISPEVFSGGYFVGDIKQVNEKDVPDFDVLTGGFPCQPFSQAGFKKGFGDIRGTLFYDIARIIKEKKPKAYFIENVRHLLNHDEGRTFARIKDVIENELGYSFHYKIVKGTDFNIPQHRPRLFMVGFRDKSIPFEFPKPLPLKKTMAHILKGETPRRVGFTLRVGGRGSGLNDRRNWDTYLVNGKPHRLTIEEGKAMMGFPKNFVFPVTETQAMKQLGNAVVVPAISAVAAEVLRTLENYDD